MTTDTTIHEPAMMPSSKMRAVADAKRPTSVCTERARIGNAVPISTAGTPMSVSTIRNEVAK